MADREQALLELSLREIYAKTTLFYYGEPATPPSAESTPRPVTPPKLSIGAPALDLEDGEIERPMAVLVLERQIRRGVAERVDDGGGGELKPD